MAIEFHKIWIEQCEAARNIEGGFNRQQALDYLIGEKFLNYLEAADDDPKFRAEIPEFVAEIKRIFERWQLAQYLETHGSQRSLIRVSTTTQMMPRLSVNSTSAAVPLICFWWNGPGSGCWRMIEVGLT